MKIYRLFQLVCLMLALCNVSCVDDTFMDRRSPVEEGLPTCVRLSFVAEGSKVVTRYAQEPTYENRVDNIYVLVFNGSGNVHYRRFYIPGEGLSYDNKDTMSSGTVEFNTESLGGATIVGIANLTTETTSTAYTIGKETLDGINSLNDLKALVMTMKNQSVDRGSLFMMTGYAKDGAGNTVVDIPSNESDTPVDCTLQLERTDAKIMFQVKAVNPKPSEWSEFSFRPTGWTVKQVPQQSLLLPSDEGKDVDGTYFNSLSYDFEEFYRSDDSKALYTGGSFVFYMPENRKQPLQTIVQEENTEAARKAAYAQRGASEGTYENGDKIFTNAHPHSTYVEITGLLSYFNEDGYLVYANVRFTIHLGYADGDVNDYTTLRNHYYTYTITIRGADDITTEVEGGAENPGYEGDVVENFQNSYEFDSHYDRRLITLNRSGFTDAGAVYWGVNTPFSKGVHTVGETLRDAMKDYRWIKFAINQEYGVADNVYVKYPGDQNYNDPFPVDGAVEGKDYNASSPYYTQGSGYYGHTSSHPDARLRDVDQLLTFLKSEAQNEDSEIFDKDGNVAITVFVDENVYVRDPNTNEEDLTLWKKMAETGDRQLYIIVEDAKYTDDGQSSVIKAQYSFRQGSIRTVFNIYDTNLTKAWGLESKMETGRLGAGGLGGQGTSSSNGRLNTIKCILDNNYSTNKNVKWTEILGVDKAYSLIGDQTAVRACLLRNRDLNGDNIVDANEIRWYLAAIDQLTDIYIGEYALDEQSRLYPRSAADRVDESGNQQVRWHYTSSTSNGNTDSWIIWAEEGASRGGSSGSIKDEKDSNGNDIKNTYFSYRCLRNLGVIIENPDDEPESFIEVKSETGGSYLIDLSKMHVNARRTNAEVNALPLHNERSLNNKPYAKFRVHADVFPTPNNSNGSWNSQNWTYFQTFSGYPTGYRIPNQRELLIMATRMPSNAWRNFGTYYNPYKPFYMCQTSFSMDGDFPYTGVRDGFYWDSNSGNFILQNSTGDKGYVRPVQDVTD